MPSVDIPKELAMRPYLPDRSRADRVRVASSFMEIYDEEDVELLLRANAQIVTDAYRCMKSYATILEQLAAKMHGIDREQLRQRLIAITAGINSNGQS